MFACSKTVERTFQDESYIFRQGETPKNLFLLLEGVVMLSKDFAAVSDFLRYRGIFSTAFAATPANITG